MLGYASSSFMICPDGKYSRRKSACVTILNTELSTGHESGNRADVYTPPER